MKKEKRLLKHGLQALLVDDSSLAIYRHSKQCFPFRVSLSLVALFPSHYSSLARFIHKLHETSPNSQQTMIQFPKNLKHLRSYVFDRKKT